MGLFGSTPKKGWSADRAHRRSVAHSTDLIDRLPGIFAGVDAAEAQQKGLISEGFDSARSELNLAGRGAEMFIGDTLRREEGQLQQNLISGGMTGSTIGRNAFRGVGSNADRRMADLQGLLAPMFAQNQQQKGMALASATGQSAMLKSAAHVESLFALQKGAMSLGAGAGQGGGGGMFGDMFSDIGSWLGDLGVSSVEGGGGGEGGG